MDRQECLSYLSMKILVTGGAGFIGSAFVRMMLGSPDAPRIINLDKLTYAGNLENLAPVNGNAQYRFVQGDICDETLVASLITEEGPDVIVHFAAESHVDRSIFAPSPVFETNLRGTFTLLEAARAHHAGRFIHVSTDEVYGSLAAPLEADENFPLNPSSPYSSSKAGSDLLVRSYFTTYRVPVIITRASNNYGPYQFPEKLIPLMISNALEGRVLPVYGDGMQVRDWLYVDDHCRAIRALIAKGHEGEIYNIGGSRALPNIEIVHKIVAATGAPEALIQSVKDRPGHDRRYALSSEKIMRETGWRPEVSFDDGLTRTINWYRENMPWVARVKTGEYRNYYARNYENRESELRTAGAHGRQKA
jgi:dTDP-glucose 4,6-dehydratase